MKLEKLILEEDVLERARRLEEPALSALVRKSYPFVFRYFYYRSIDREDAEDLTGEVFVRIVNSIKGQKGYFPAWLISIAKNLLADYYRKQGKSRETSWEDVGEAFLDCVDDETCLLRPDEIRKMLDRLTDEQREVILLRFIEGHSNEEAASIMNKSVGAIKAPQFRALSVLRTFRKELA